MKKKKKIQIILGVMAFFLAGILYLGLNGRQESGEVVTGHFTDGAGESVKEDDPEQTASSVVYVHICGAVKKPGVYTFPSEPHIIDVVKQAGGFTKKADSSSVNLAEKVADGTQLVVTEKRAEEKANEEQSSHEKSSASGGSDKVNINTASAEELMTLSGIGESKAAQIVSYRESNGAFQKIEDIMKISGIKEGVFSKIKDYITV